MTELKCCERWQYWCVALSPSHNKAINLTALRCASNGKLWRRYAEENLVLCLNPIQRES